MPGVSGVTVVTTLVCFFTLHTRLRAHRAPGIPCALHGARDLYKLGAENAYGIAKLFLLFDIVVEIARAFGVLP